MNLSLLTRYLMTAAVSGAGLTCAVALVCPPSLAQQASMSGAATVSTPLGYVSSVSMEVVLPNGMYFPGIADGSYTVTPSYTTMASDPSSTSFFASTLTLNGGTAIAPSPQYSFEAAAANALNIAAGGSTTGFTNPALWEPVAGIVKAGAGIDGF